MTDTGDREDVPATPSWDLSIARVYKLDFSTVKLRFQRVR